MEIKKTLNNIPRLVFWRIDDALLFLIPFSLAILFGSLLLIILSGSGVYFYTRFRKRHRTLNIKAMLYWTLGAGFPTIPSHIRNIRR